MSTNLDVREQVVEPGSPITVVVTVSGYNQALFPALQTGRAGDIVRIFGYGGSRENKGTDAAFGQIRATVYRTVDSQPEWVEISAIVSRAEIEGLLPQGAQVTLAFAGSFKLHGADLYRVPDSGAPDDGRRRAQVGALWLNARAVVANGVTVKTVAVDMAKAPLQKRGFVTTFVPSPTKGEGAPE